MGDPSLNTMLARPLFCAVIALLVAPVLSATVTWTTYTDATCTTLCPNADCTTTIDTATTCNQNTEASMNNLVCESSLIRYNNFPNTGSTQSTYSACDSSVACFENVLMLATVSISLGLFPLGRRLRHPRTPALAVALLNQQHVPQLRQPQLQSQGPPQLQPQRPTPHRLVQHTRRDFCSLLQFAKVS